MTSHEPLQTHSSYEQTHSPYEQTHSPYEQTHSPYEQTHSPYEQTHSPYEQTHSPYEQTHHNYGLEHHQFSYSSNHYGVNHSTFRVGYESSGHPNPGVSLESHRSGDRVYVIQQGVTYVVTIDSVSSSGGNWVFTVRSNDGFFVKTIQSSEIYSRA
jgi:hypothetical protein